MSVRDGKIKAYINKIRKIRYDNIHKKQAQNALAVISSETNYTIPQKEKLKIKEYAKEVFGSTTYASWLYVYAAYNQDFKEGWIPDNYFGFVVAPNVNKGIGAISNIKTLSKKIIKTNLLPDRYYLIDSVLYDTEYNIIDSSNAKEVLFSNDTEYFLKKDSSNQGKGVIKITKDNFDKQNIFSLTDSVIQESIKQSDWFNEIVTGSVATLRITTVKNKNKEVKKSGSYLRIGRKGNDIVQSAQNIRVPIINENGMLGEFGSDPEWRRYYEHPDTNFKFKNQTIPYYRKAVRECIDLHQQLPHFSIIGWDVSITNDGDIKIMEWNAGHPDIKFTEASIGPGFKGLGWEDIWRENT